VNFYPQIASLEADPIPHRGTYNQDNATGFIRLNALRPANGIAAKVHKKKISVSFSARSRQRRELSLG